MPPRLRMRRAREVRYSSRTAKLLSHIMEMVMKLLLFIVGIVSTVHGQTSPNCSALPSDAVRDCVAADVCTEAGQASGTLRSIPTLLENNFACYNTCISNDTGSGHCIVSTSSPHLQPTMIASGPFHLQQYSVHKAFSPQSRGPHLYSSRHLCKYHIACSGSNVYMSVTLHSLDMDTASQCPTDRDYIRLQYPTGSQCTLCGSELGCQERGRQLDPLLLFSGHSGLLVDFNSNHIHSGCGLRLLATCVQRSFFEVSGCSVPLPPAPPSSPPPFSPDFGKRDIPDSSEHNDTRSRRYYHHRAIPVASEASVVYEDGVVRVRVGEAWVYRVGGVRVLQVYNDIEGYLTFYGAANDRSFPGYGVLNIGYGIVQYVQESVPSQFKPTEYERELIELLHRGIVDTIDNKDIQDNGSEMEQVALANGRACNGFLRAAACAYQQLHMPRVTADCLAGVPFPSSPRQALALPLPHD